MRVCHAFIFFSIKFAGGTSDLMYKLCKAQAKAGLQPVIYTGNCHFDTELAATLKGVEFKVFSSYLDKAGFSIMPALPFSLIQDIKKIDIVHMHVFRTFQNLVLYFICLKFNVPYIVDAHGAVPYFRRKNFVKRFFDHLWGRKILRNAACLIAETKVGVAEYQSIDPSLKEDDIVVLTPPFDTDEFLELPQRGLFRKQYNIGDDEIIIMFLGRVNYIKGNDFLIKGFAEFLKRQPKSRLVIVGPDDGHMDECKTIVASLSIAEKVTFTGFLYADHKHAALVDADIVAQMSRQEQGAWAPFEAILCGTPIIVTAHTGSGEDVRRLDAGYLVDFDDVGGLAEKLDYMLTHRSEVKEKTLRAKAFIEQNLSMNSRVNEYADLYNRCIRKAKKL